MNLKFGIDRRRKLCYTIPVLRAAALRADVRRNAGVAQWLECLPVTQEAASSSLVIRAIVSYCCFKALAVTLDVPHDSHYC